MSILLGLIPVATTSLAVQLVLASLFVPRAEHRFFDLSGAAGFFITSFVSIYYPTSFVRVPSRYTGILQLPTPFSQSHVQLAPRQLLLTVPLAIWTARLAAFLSRRAVKAGGDSRFEKLKYDKVRFTGVWVMQAAWVFAVGLPVYLSNLVSASAHPPLRMLEYAMLAFAGASSAVEAAADG